MTSLLPAAHPFDRPAMLARLASLGFMLPSPPQPVGAYRAVVVRRGIACVSGQFPLQEGRLAWKGAVGSELSLEQGHAAARVAALNVLAQIDAATDGMHSFGGLLRVEGYVASAPGFYQHPAVLDGASELLVLALGEELGAHARTAVAVRELPLGAPLELVVSFAMLQTD